MFLIVRLTYYNSDIPVTPPVQASALSPGQHSIHHENSFVTSLDLPSLGKSEEKRGTRLDASIQKRRRLEQRASRQNTNKKTPQTREKVDGLTFEKICSDRQTASKIQQPTSSTAKDTEAKAQRVTIAQRQYTFHHFPSSCDPSMPKRKRKKYGVDRASQAKISPSMPSTNVPEGASKKGEDAKSSGACALASKRCRVTVIEGPSKHRHKTTEQKRSSEKTLTSSPFDKPSGFFITGGYAFDHKNLPKIQSVHSVLETSSSEILKDAIQKVGGFQAGTESGDSQVFDRNPVRQPNKQAIHEPEHIAKSDPAPQSCHMKSSSNTRPSSRRSSHSYQGAVELSSPARGELAFGETGRGHATNYYVHPVTICDCTKVHANNADMKRCEERGSNFLKNQQHSATPLASMPTVSGTSIQVRDGGQSCTDGEVAFPPAFDTVSSLRQRHTVAREVCSPRSDYQRSVTDRSVHISTSPLVSGHGQIASTNRATGIVWCDSLVGSRRNSQECRYAKVRNQQYYTNGAVHTAKETKVFNSQRCLTDTFTYSKGLGSNCQLCFAEEVMPTTGFTALGIHGPRPFTEGARNPTDIASQSVHGQRPFTKGAKNSSDIASQSVHGQRLFTEGARNPTNIASQSVHGQRLFTEGARNPTDIASQSVHGQRPFTNFTESVSISTSQSIHGQRPFTESARNSTDIVSQRIQGQLPFTESVRNSTDIASHSIHGQRPFILGCDEF